MTVSSQTSTATFVGNGVATAFPLPFRFFNNSDIRAYFIDSTTGAATPMVLGTDYTLIGAGEPEVDGSALSLLTTTNPLASMRGLYVERVMPQIQETDIVNQGQFFASTHEDVFDRMTMLIQQANANSNGAIRVAIGDPEPQRLVPAAQRANLLLGFNPQGQPIAVAPASGSASDLAIMLANAFDQSKGASLVGYRGRTAHAKLDDVVSVKDFGVVGDGVTDDTAAIAAAITYADGKKLIFTPGTYLISSISVSGSVDIDCVDGVVFKRKGGADVTDGSIYAVGAAMFEVSENGANFSISNFTYDGNNSNQPAVAPVGMFFRVQPGAIVGADPITVHIRRGVFKNGTSGYLLLRGDDVNRRYETHVKIEDCFFYETLVGRGKGDPSVPAALGYLPTYVYVLDYVKCTTVNFHAEFNLATGVGEYAATALNGTFFGNIYANSGESFVWMYGTTYIKNLGRSAKKYDGTNDWVTNNGIGAIDCYGNADTLFIEHLVADNCQNVPMRAKGSTKNFTLLKGVLTNCHRGVQVGPSTTGACETVAYIGSFKATGGTLPQLEFVGNSTVDPLLSIKVDSAYISGTITNPESRVNEGVIRFRNVNFAQVENSYIQSAPIRGLEFTDVAVSFAEGFVIDACVSGPAVLVQGGKNSTINNFKITNSAATAIALQNNTTVMKVSNGYIENSGNYAVFSNNTTTHLTVENVESNTVTGTGRSFYAGGGDVAFIRNKSSGAAAPLFVVAGTNKREDHNSWNPVIQYAAAAPTAGTWKVGDLTYNIAPVASGTIGWVCTVAGTPGTWKTFGAITA